MHDESDLEEMKKDEIVLVEEISDELKELRFKMQKASTEYMKSIFQKKLTKAPEDKEDEMIKEHESELARMDFWFQVRKKYRIYDRNVISVRKGFKLVTKEEKKDDDTCDDCGGKHDSKDIEDIKKMIGDKGMVINLSDILKKILKKEEE